ncbi:MAG: ADP-ribosylglycohydrolase family protein [Thermoplasmata archaeon]
MDVERDASIVSDAGKPSGKLSEKPEKPCEKTPDTPDTSNCKIDPCNKSNASDNILLSRYCGCLLGLAVGDALGAPLEFLTESQIKQRYGFVKSMIGGGWLDLKPGQFTDDTEMALAIVKSVIEMRRIEPNDIARKFLDWYLKDPKDIGNTTRFALHKLSEGARWDQAGDATYAMFKERAASNGSLMRTAPVTLADAGNPERMKKDSAAVSRITHAHPRCIASCVAYNLLLDVVIRGIQKDELEVWLQAISKEIEGIDEPTAEVLRGIGSLNEDKLAFTGYVLHTLQSSIYSFLRTSSFSECLLWIVNKGGDADTNGAVAGALAGSYYGMEAIPAEWIKALDVNPATSDTIIRFASRLLEISNSEKKSK